jgi:hypothetical protein
MPRTFISVGFVGFHRSVGTIDKERSAHLSKEILSPSLIPPEVAPHVGSSPASRSLF